MTICKKFELSFVFFFNGLIEFAILHAIVTFHSGIFVVMCANTDYRCPMKLFFSLESRTFGLGHTFYKKNKPLYPDSKYLFGIGI